MNESGGPADDRLARVLESGLIAVLLIAPLPFGSVGPSGRLLLELSALALLLTWLLRALRRGMARHSRAAGAAMVLLLGLGVIQLVPLGNDLVGLVSPRAARLRDRTQPPPAALEAERRLLEIDPASLGPPSTISLDPGATGSALRTGVALFALLLVAIDVGAVRGARRIALALLVSASFQGLYGLLVLVSGHDRIWHLPKRAYLDAATGTFVNKNHFACFLAMGLACGVGLILSNARRRRSGRGTHRLAAAFGAEGSRNLTLVVLLVVGLAGLLASFSRAGITVGLAALLLTVLLAGRFLTLRTRLVVATLLVVVATVPLLRIGPDRLARRFAESTQSLIEPGGRARVWLDTRAMIAANPVAGTGFGTFAAAYPLHRSPEVRLYYAHAHNDALQFLVEGGLVGAVGLALLAVPLGAALGAAFRRRKGLTAVGLAAGLTAILLHGLVDFNFHIPANAATAAILAGTLLGLPCRRN